MIGNYKCTLLSHPFTPFFLIPSYNLNIPTYSNKVILNMSDNPLSLLQLSYLTLQAVLQAVIICLFGFICTQKGLLPPQAQKYISQLNVQLFTPCLIFTKLASSLSFETLLDIAIIPVFYAFSTLVTYTCARVVSKMFRFTKRETNFVTALAVFGNSNSVPVTITVAIAYSLPGLEWDNVRDDNPDKVASRGIMYLLVFQQLGQILRWSWGYNKLLAKPTEEELREERREREILEGIEGTIESADISINKNKDTLSQVNETTSLLNSDLSENIQQRKGYMFPGGLQNGSRASSKSSSLSETETEFRPDSRSSSSSHQSSRSNSISSSSSTVVYSSPLQNPKSFISKSISWFLSVMNPPLWSMLLAITIASIPFLKNQFYSPGTFINRTISSSVRQLGAVAIPLILVILGSNLSPDDSLPPASPNYSKLILAGLMSRIFIPSLLIIPLVTALVKYFPISVLDDPIFLLVSFLLTISPPAIQLSQISQLNKVFEREMAGVLFWGYAVVTLPTMIVVVVLAIKLMEWVN